MDFATMQTTAMLMYYASAFRGLVNGAPTDYDVTAGIREKSPCLAILLEKGGAELFPEVAPENHIAAAATATFDPELTMWIQAAVNKYVQPEPDKVLEVDGCYGPKTVEAVKAAQEKLGIKPDGFAGKATLAALTQKLDRQVKAPLA